MLILIRTCDMLSSQTLFPDGRMTTAADLERVKEAKGAGVELPALFDRTKSDETNLLYYINGPVGAVLTRNRVNGASVLVVPRAHVVLVLMSFFLQATMCDWWHSTGSTRVTPSRRRCCYVGPITRRA